jgi:hypothetical protein
MELGNLGQERDLDVADLQGAGDGLDNGVVFGDPAGLERVPLGRGDADQLGRLLNAEMQLAAALLDPAGKDGGQIRGVVRCGLSYSYTQYSKTAPTSTGKPVIS